MRFELTDEQVGFAGAIGDLMKAADSVAVARSWAAGDHAPGQALWRRLAELGVSALVVPEEHDGMGATAVDLAVAFETLGYHLAVGPWIETAAFLPTALADPAALAAGQMATVGVDPVTPFALDADVAEAAYVVTDGSVRPGTVAQTRQSLDVTRRLSALDATGDPVGTAGAEAFDLAALACAAQLLGAGERLLADSVSYVKQRRQFGREIGSYQAIKHALADVRIALDFARPLLHGAATLWDGTDRSRDVSAAKVACADAGYLAARTGLQVHGAIGYTAEFDLGLWINRVRALVGAWGTPAHHRGRVLAALEGAH